jgi:hypothetical protein
MAIPHRPLTSLVRLSVLHFAFCILPYQRVPSRRRPYLVKRAAFIGREAKSCLAENALEYPKAAEHSQAGIGNACEQR